MDEAVFAEALRLVAEGDPSSVTRRAIAEGAGVSRQTLYNRWPTTADIVLDALLDRAASSVGVHSSAGLRGYLVELAAAVEGWARPGLRALAGFAQLDHEFAERFRGRFVAVRHGALEAAIRGQMPETPEVEWLAELVAGSLWFRVLVADLPLDDAWVGGLVATVERASS
ncbi:MAG: TetR/AcrR family transcriptional regulator C-terminal ligand-binding domain-containing protein [Actinomycetota bacterium]